MKLKRYLFLAGFLVLVVGFFWARSQIFAVKQDSKIIPFQLAEVRKGDIFSRISTTGMVNPVLSVTVSTQVSGTIKELLVDVNSEVKKGQVIARLDQDLFHAAVLQARAKLEDALANLAKEKAGVKMQKEQIEASIDQTKASYKNLEEKYKRAAELYDRQLISRDEYDTARAEWEVADARFKETSARVDETKVKEAFIRVAEAQVKKARADLELAQIELSRSIIRAPVSGTVIVKNVEAGQTVAASLQSPPLVTIADLTQMKVDAWVDEADIGKVRLGQEVEFQVDSFPERAFNGKVVKVYPSPLIENNVVTYDTEIHVDNQDLALKPGMTANVTIILAKKDEVVIAPLKALKVGRSHIRKVYPEIDEGREEERRPRRSRAERAERERRRFIEGKGRVWVYRNGKPERARIRFGATDTEYMEILDGLAPGDQLIVGIKAEAVKTQGASAGGWRGRRVRREVLGGF